jgi:Flp pilus assembly protein TadB
MMAEDTAQNRQDAEEHRKTYVRIMKATGEFGLPAIMGLAVFFTNLVMRNSLPVAIVAFIVTYLLVWFIVRTFFSH